MSNRLPYEVIAGLDFGTTFTKCIVRNLVNEAECFPVMFELKGGRSEHFVPSLIIRSQGRVGTPFDTEMRGDGYVNFLKMRLLGHMDSSAKPWNTSGTQDEARSDVAFFLAHVICGIRKFIQKKWGDFGSHTDDVLRVNICIPVGDANRANVENEFLATLSAAYASVRLANGKVEVFPSFNEVQRAIKDRTAVARGWDYCASYPETSSNLQAFLKSPARRPGLYVMVDVGGGTLDVSIFRYIPANATDNRIIYLYSEVICSGSSQIDMRLKERIPSADISYLRQLKETKIGFSGAAREQALDALANVQHGIYNEVARAMGRTIENSRTRISPNPVLAIKDLKSVRFFFVGKGFVKYPYEDAIRFFHEGWDEHPPQVTLSPPSDIRWPVGLVPASLFVRFTVAYGLSFLRDNLEGCKFPDQVQWQPPFKPDWCDNPSADFEHT
jgi:hypothetical protein